MELICCSGARVSAGDVKSSSDMQQGDDYGTLVKRRAGFRFLECSGLGFSCEGFM